MNNQQFILLIMWVCFVSAYIGYAVGGAILAFLAGITVPMIFLMIGD